MKNSVLIIDDQPSNILAFSKILGDEYHIYVAKNGPDGIKCAVTQQPDIILLDVLMPDMDGYDVIKVLKNTKESQSIPVIFVTSLDTKEEEKTGLTLGAADYIKKPFHTATVKLRVKNQIELIRLQRELEDAVIAAQTANNAKSAFLANMSHEIRTPMNVIVGLTELLLEDDVPFGDIKSHLKKINMASDILLGLINDILDISKIESGKLSLTPIQYEPAQLLHDIITLNIIRAEDKPIKFNLEIDGDIYQNLFGDDLRVKQVLNNLLSNAFKYTKEGIVTLGISSKREGDKSVRLNLSVKDTGIGIRSEDINNLFEDFNQVDAHANRLIEGTGLGLSIAKGLAELMDGEITVESEYGKGSVFHVSLLQEFVSEETICTETIKALQELRYDNNKSMHKLIRPDLSYANVLVVDDYEPNLDVAQWMLGKYKMKVDCVTSGQEAIDAVQLKDPVYDAVFMDQMMPEIDGIEAVRQIRALESDYAKTVPIIALTANAIAGTEQLFLENGFQAFLAKPIDRIKLDSLIRKWIMQNDTEGTSERQNGSEQSSSSKNDCNNENDSNNEQDDSREPIEINGINTKQGLYLFEDDREMYLDFIQSFADLIPAELNKLREVSDKTLQAYSINVHTIKGASAGIGADELSGYAKQLELMAKAGDLPGVLSENDKFIKIAERLISDITKWFESRSR